MSLWNGLDVECVGGLGILIIVERSGVDWGGLGGKWRNG